MTGASQPGTAVIIDQATIYALLLEVRDDVRDVKAKVDELANDSHDHEQRIRVLETRVWKASGMAAVIASGAGFFLTRLLG